MIPVRLFSVSLLFISAACASSGDGRRGEGLTGEKTAPVASQDSPQKYLEQTSSITAQEFIDQPPGNLEALLGPPAFVRSEGVGEFRRYDTDVCRVYAVIAADPGARALVKSISVGGLKPDGPSPAFGECLKPGS